MTPLDFFSDPTLRAPSIGAFLMCLSAALMGVVVFVQKRSLLGEALAHATYPGVTGALLFVGGFACEGWISPLILIGAFISGLLGYGSVHLLIRRLKVAPDAALCAVLSLFFGVGVTLASITQASFPRLHRQMQAYLYGQAATMTDQAIWIYSLLTLIVIGFLLLFYKEILAFTFDTHFARVTGLAHRMIEGALIVLTVLSLVIGIRCVGVILMSAMLIAPAVAARQFTNRLSRVFSFAALIGGVSGFLGVYLSVVLSQGSQHYSLPTGPMIVLVGGFFALCSLLFAPKRGLIVRYARAVGFKITCLNENLLKMLWRFSETEKKCLTFKEIRSNQGLSRSYLFLLLMRLRWQNHITKEKGTFALTDKGLKRGARIVRLHRLWEVYLVNVLGVNVNRVHKSAEEMEHILTPELEKRLAQLLQNPTQDPHMQPIPSHEEVHA